MTGKEVGHYALAVVLFLATVPLYRYIIERGHAADTRSDQAPLPAVVERVPTLPSPVARDQVPESVSVECIHGKLYRRDSTGAVLAGSCPVVVGLAQPDSSTASD